MRLNFGLGYRALFLITLLFSLFWGQLTPIHAKSEISSNLVQQGVVQYHQGEYLEAIANWQKAFKIFQQEQNLVNQARVSENIARAYQKLGNSSSAVTSWAQTISFYKELNNKQKIGRSLTEQAQAYSALGQQPKAISILCGTTEDECLPNTAISLAREQEDSLGEAAALGSLGESLRLRGNYSSSLANFEASLKLAQNLNNFSYQIAALNGLGNTYKSLGQVRDRRVNSAILQKNSDEEKLFREQAQEQYKQALLYYQEGLELAHQQQDDLGEMRTLLNLVPLHYLTQQPELAQQSKITALNLLNNLKDTREKAFASIKLAKFTPSGVMTPTECLQPSEQQAAEQLFQQSLNVSRQITDKRGESFALGELGHLYECRFESSESPQDYRQAKNFTQQARLIAEQELAAKDVLYRWEWQTARLLRLNNESRAAMIAYQRAIATLEDIRDDILSGNRDLQYDFRDTVEPIYRNLMDLQLDEVPAATLIERQAPSSQNLDSFLNTFDALKLAELQNYFGNDCVLEVVKDQRIDELEQNQTTAIFSSVIFDKRTGIVVSFPDGSKKVNWLEQSEAKLREDINRYRFETEASHINLAFEPKEAQTVYQWLIAPFAEDLEQAKIKTLVFVQDGILRSVPMSALHDGKQFLIQKYAIATTPSLTLTSPQAIDRKQITALALGLTEETKLENGSFFTALPNVEREIKIVDAKLEGSTSLLDQQFTKNRFEQELNENIYPIVHIATHGKFSSEPEDTFLITGDGQKLTISELDRLIRSTPKGAENIELLFLTACQTAAGDDRAALGLAGVALQAGVKSALASLWFIEDNKTPELVEEFYASLQSSNITKAEALQKAQVKLIEENIEPAIWSPFILIGNWL